MFKYKGISLEEFTSYLFDNTRDARQAAEILAAILRARSARLTEIAAQMRGSLDAAYKRLQRFLQRTDPRLLLWRLCPEDVPFIIGDVTEIPRPQATKTSYVGTLKDGRTKGFWMLTLAAPYRGRAIPCGLFTFSSATIAHKDGSRNLVHQRALSALKDILGERPLVLDREFSYLGLLEFLTAAGIHFVIRLRMGSRPPKFFDEEKREVKLTIAPGQQVVYRNLWYKGKVQVQVIGIWLKGQAQPLWVMTDLEPEQGLAYYRQRMKIEESYRDLKSLLGIERVMNKRQDRMEKILALILLAYAIALLVGEQLRDALFGGAEDSLQESPTAKGNLKASRRGKWRRYSGVFVLLKGYWPISRATWASASKQALAAFVSLVLPAVPTHV